MRFYLLLLFFSFSFILNAQQTVGYSHAFYKPMINNPAFAGNEDALNALLISRSQWINFKNAPQLNLFVLDGRLNNKKMGLGIDIVSDKKGISTKLGGNIYYSYNVLLNENSKFQFGISLGLIDHTLNYAGAVIQDSYDPFIIGTSQKETTINGNAGIAFIWKKLEAGFSVPQFFGDAIEYQDNVSGKAYYSLSRYYSGTLKNKFLISENKQLALTPFVIVRFAPAIPIKYDANLTLEWKDKFWIGATYKSEYAISANAGFIIRKQFYIGYSYDFVVGNIGKYPGMSHEIMLNYIFGRSKNKNAEAVSANSTTEHTDSLNSELEIKDNKIRMEEERVKELSKQLHQSELENEKLKMVSIQGVKDTMRGIPVLVINTGSSEMEESDVMIIPASSDDFLYMNKTAAKNGYYVVVGVYLNKKLAESELSRLESEGYSTSEILYSSSKQLHYVTASLFSKKEDAKKTIMKIKGDGVDEVWILSVQNR